MNNKHIRNIFLAFIGLCALILSSTCVNAKSIYSQKPVLSILGDSISTYSIYGEPYSYYGPKKSEGVSYVMKLEDTWWHQYATGNGYEIGYSSSVGMAEVSMDDSEYLSFNNLTRIYNLAKNGIPDVIAVYGGINDTTYGSSNPTKFYSRYNTLVSKLHTIFPDVRLILITPYYFLNNDLARFFGASNELVDSYSKSIEDISKAYNDYYVDLRHVVNDYKYVVAKNDMHPNESGMDVISLAIEDALRNARGDSFGIESIKANLDYDHYIIKVNAYSDYYDGLLFKFKLTNKNTNEVIYDENWSKNNCFELRNIDTKATYTAYAEIDRDGDGNADATLTNEFKNLAKKRTGGTVYNGVDYSKVYNFNYYVENNADLYNAYKNNPQGALEHFVKNGMSEARQAKSTFNVISYRNQWADLRRAFGWNNLVAYYKHYMDSGYKEGRRALGCTTLQNPINNFLGYDCSAIYDFQYYIEHNPDVKNAFNADEQQVFLHFITCGMSEGRRSCANFDVYSYRNQYSDLRQVFGWNNLASYYAHYNDYGKREGRAGTGCATLQNPIHSFWGVDFSPVYNYQYYIKNNPDVYRAYNGDDSAIFGHFLACGVNEGRRASERFDVVSYRNQWADLRQVFGWNNLAQYYFHYVNAGAKEGRTATGCNKVQNPTHTFLGIDISAVYDYQYYIEHNPDVKNAFGGDDTAVMIHFVASGMTEGRQASKDFNVWTYATNNPDLVRTFGLDLAQYYLHYMKCGKREGRIAS